MRVFILALFALAIFGSASVANAGPSLENRELVASADSVVVAQEGTQQTEDQVGFDKGKRLDVQRRLKRLGFATKANGRFDKSTRAVIARWQAARGYPDTGFLNASQHQAMLTESVSEARASLESRDKSEDERPARRRTGGRHHSSAGGPVAFIGGVVGGLFGRR